MNHHILKLLRGKNMAAITFEGIDDMMKDLKDMEKLLDSGQVDTALKESILPAYNLAKRTAPKDKTGHKGKGKGHMADALPLGRVEKQGKTRSISYGWQKSDSSKHYYAKFVEWGTSNKNYPKQPFLYKSMKKEKTVCLNIFSDRIKGMLKL